MKYIRIIMNDESVGVWNVVTFSVSSHLLSADTEAKCLRIIVNVINFTQDSN
jgi:hypothetical protein